MAPTNRAAAYDQPEMPLPEHPAGREEEFKFDFEPEQLAQEQRPTKNAQLKKASLGASGSERYLRTHEHLRRQLESRINGHRAAMQRIREASMRSRGYVTADAAQQLRYLEDVIRANSDEIMRLEAMDRGTALRAEENMRAAARRAPAKPAKPAQSAKPAQAKQPTPSPKAPAAAAKVSKAGKVLRGAGKVLGAVGQAAMAYDMAQVGKKGVSRMEQLTGQPMMSVKTPRGWANVPSHDENGRKYGGPQEAYFAARRSGRTIKTYRVKRDAREALREDGVQWDE